ncbi:DUF4382 domain-containing protein [Sorangium sp. So ce131]|uniref:DUF4382 domain-containing protein n=1 Tax=Sorangium sp. So ce131 TaxID=3133282 RepID=UPI003F601E28
MRALSSHVVLFGFFALAITGCGGGDATVEVGVTAQPLEVAAPSEPEGTTDTAAQRRLSVTVTEVNVHVAGDGAEAEDDADEGSPADDGEPAEETLADEQGWVTVFSGATKVDLFDAAATEQLLGSGEIPAGKITQVRLVLADVELVDGDVTSPVACPSCSESGLKIVTRGAVEVSPGDTLHLTLDFDQAGSLTEEESGYRLDPVIKIIAAEER